MKKMSKKTALLAAIIIFSAVGGIMLLLSPSRERQAVEDGQEALMQEILAEMENNLAREEIISAPQTDDGETNEDETPAENETPYEPEHGEYGVFSPLPDAAFPSGIHGIGILTIERIDLHLPVAEGVTEEILRIAPGRVPQTAQVGDVGNAVIAGHRNYTRGTMFNRLGELEIGDIVNFQARNGEEMIFEVFEIAVIEPHDQIAFVQPVNDSIITLYTCTPVRTATHRLIVRAKKILQV